MKMQTFASVWDAICDTPTEAERMARLSALMIALQRHIEGQGMNDDQAAQALDVSPGQVAELLRGAINAFDLATLERMAKAAGLPPDPR